MTGRRSPGFRGGGLAVAVYGGGGGRLAAGAVGGGPDILLRAKILLIPYFLGDCHKFTRIPSPRESQ